MMRDIDQRDLDRAEIRALQALYPEAHAALVNWGRWSRDRRGIFPVEITPPSMWDEAQPSKFGDFGDEPDAPEDGIAAKAERADREEYDEKAGYELDSRIHGPGGLAQYLREAARIAYVSREIPEDQFHRLAGTTPQGFRERLSDVLAFVGRHAGR